MHWRIVFRTSLSLLGLTVSAAGQTEGAAPAEEPSAAPPEAPPAAPAPDGAETPPADGLPPETEAPEEPSAPEPSPGQGEPDPRPELGPPPGADGDEEFEEPELPMTPPATDGLSGHFLLGAGAAYQKPLGKFGSGMRQSSQVDGGLSVTVDAGFGVSRQVVIGAWGQWFSLPEGSECDECSATGFAGGPFVRFHLVQGLRFDPWLSFAVGYRDLRLDDGTEELKFKGIDWARLQVGGDWYPARNLGFGPFLELVSGGYFDRPEVAGDLRTYWQWSAGMRLVFDVPGKLD
ncbi:MAG TPA: hypothetical protein VFU02_01285 [Polyangiaceae bacterium]|nr:hypothetical protein [Polyangiaceae bacterium]